MRLLEASEASFARKLKSDSKLKRIARKARKSTSYVVANDYAVRVGELLSESLTENVRDLDNMSEEVAREVLMPTLTADHDLVSEVSKTVQDNMNEADGYGIETLVPVLDTNRIEGLASKIASYDTMEEALWLFNEPVINFSMNVVDEAIRINFEANSKMGIKEKLIRKTESSGTGYRKIKYKNKVYTYPYKIPCDWCKKMAGEYEYRETWGSDVYRKHEGCRCTLDLIRNGKREDVWNKVEWSEGDSATRSELIQQRTEQKRQEEERKAQQRQTRTAAIDRIQRELHYSPQGAGRLYNAWKRDGKLERYTLDYLIATAQS